MNGKASFGFFRGGSKTKKRRKTSELKNSVKKGPKKEKNLIVRKNTNGE